MRSTAAPYTESRLTRSVANERVGFPVVEHSVKNEKSSCPKIFLIAGVVDTGELPFILNIFPNRVYI